MFPGTNKLYLITNFNEKKVKKILNLYLYTVLQRNQIFESHVLIIQKSSLSGPISHERK